MDKETRVSTIRYREHSRWSLMILAQYHPLLLRLLLESYGSSLVITGLETRLSSIMQ